MPIYEYRCKKCGRHFEKIQKFSDAPLDTCENCRAKLERLLSSPAIHFKGKGWYVTDYGRSKPAPASETTAKSEKPAEAGSKAGSSETTPSKGSKKKESSE
jgi:putative FmdB family regulatory protein